VSSDSPPPPQGEPKAGSAAALRDLSTSRVNAQILKLEEQARQPWSAQAASAIAKEAAVLNAWSARESSSYLAATAEQVARSAESVARATTNQLLDLTDRLDTFNAVTKQSTDRLARWTAVMALAAFGLILIGAFQIWLVWSHATR
jgi:hypothetical protein